MGDIAKSDTLLESGKLDDKLEYDNAECMTEPTGPRIVPKPEFATDSVEEETVVTLDRSASVIIESNEADKSVALDDHTNSPTEAGKAMETARDPSASPQTESATDLIYAKDEDVSENKL